MQADPKQIFFTECEDYLGSANDQFDLLDGAGDSAAPLNALFRAVHSIKGGARAFGMARLAGFAHTFESFMDSLRKGKAALDDQNYARLTLGFDMLAHLVGEARDGTADGGFDTDGFAAELRGLEAGTGPAGEPPPPPEEKEEEEEEGPPADQTSLPVLYHYRLTITPDPTMLACGVDPLLLLRNLAELGLATTEIDLSRLPPLQDLNLDVAYFRWTVELTTEADRATLQDILEYVDDVATIEVAQQETEGDAQGETEREGEHAVGRTEDGTEERHKPSSATAPAASAAPPAPAPLSAVSPASPPGRGPPVAGPPGVGPPVAGPPGAGKEERRVASVRVDLPKLERLGNMVGELVIAQAMLQQQAADIPEADRPGLFRAIKDMSQFIRDLQDIAQAVRAQPLKTAFSRLIPVCRELERATGKTIRLSIRGGETEIDKTVVDRLAEPLTHLIRNAAGHGLEPPAERRARGKPPEGTIVLSARQRGSQVFIVIEDDGAGIDRDAVRRKARERGLIEPEAELSDLEVDNLIFLPGFSTAKEVTEVSGRGVGMDVVRQTIVECGGQIVVESRPGLGCRFTLILPLSLAIIDVLVAKVGAQRYLLPIGNVVESLRPLPHQVLLVPGRGRFLDLRGTMLPITALAREFTVPGAIDDPTQGILVVSEVRRGLLGAILVDDVLGQEPVVVKSLERNYHRVPGISAATILGDGRAALIVDFSGLGRGAVGAPQAPAAVR